MQAEIVSQVLDSLSFIMVTPEFLGSERIAAMRSQLQSFLRGGDPDKRLTFKQAVIGFFFVGIPLILVAMLLLSNTNLLAIIRQLNSQDFWYHSQGNYSSQLIIELKILSGIFAFLFGFTIAFVCGIFLILSLLEAVLVRFVVFFFGVIAFFASRAIMIWLR